MILKRSIGHGGGGMVLPVVLVVSAVVFALAVAAISMTGSGRRTARLRVDRVRADMAVESGRAALMALLSREAAHDGFVVVKEEDPSAAADGMRMPSHHLWLASPRVEQGGPVHRYHPLFSSRRGVADSRWLEVPVRTGIPGDRSADSPVASFSPFPWMDPVHVDWCPVVGEDGRQVARYAYWVEDLQARMDPRLVGNRHGSDGGHQRVAFPVPGGGDRPLSADEPQLNQVALEALVPPGASPGPIRNLLDQRNRLWSPESVLAAAGMRPPLARVAPAQAGNGVWAGDLVDEAARRIERDLIAGIQAYHERPLVPCVEGVAAEVVGEPRLNLNALLAGERAQAVERMAGWIRRALPDFDTRKGGFPDDYLATLAASALDYADPDGDPTVSEGSHVGIDSHPVLSEIVLHLHYRGLEQVEDGWVMRWRFRLFAELWNMSNQPVRAGEARLSYEVNLTPTTIGLGGVPRPFDDPGVLDDEERSHHDLQRIGDRYFGPPVVVDLDPDEYRFHEFATVDYSLPVMPQLDGDGRPWPEPFALVEPEDGARGIRLLWNGQPVQDLWRLIRDPHGLSHFVTTRTRKTAKACIPGLNYGSLGAMVNNMGDPRIAPYLRHIGLGENAYPDNLSPHRRNIRRHNIYDRDPSPQKVRHYGRVMPSQWPDGGHDSPVGDFFVTTGHAALPTDREKWPLDEVPAPLPGNAPQRISNRGRYDSPTELGRIFDPVMWLPVFADLPGHPGSGLQDTAELAGDDFGPARPSMPLRRNRWPEVTPGSAPSRNHGGGNTLRIGRPEHPRFDRPGMRAAQLLDLFHVGIPTSPAAGERDGPLQRIDGQVNVNTAGRDVLRCLAAGVLKQDPELCRVSDWAHDLSGPLRPHLRRVDISPPSRVEPADEIAEAIIRGRPYACLSQLAQVTDADGVPVFGNPGAVHEDGRLQWSDAAAEEVFARVHDAATVRSRNFRVWVIGQALAEREDGAPEVRARSARVFTLFVDPGERAEDGSPVAGRASIRILHERAFDP